MTVRARSLLALFCAAALLQIGCCFQHCSTLKLGRHSSSSILLPQRTTGSHDYLYVPDQCAAAQQKLVGQDARVCDTVGYFPPTAIPFGAGSFSPLWVDCAQENPQPCYELLTVDVTQYCEDKEATTKSQEALLSRLYYRVD